MQRCSIWQVISDNVGINSAAVLGATPVTTTGSTRTWTASFDYGDYSYGSTTEVYTLIVTDAAGNSSTANVSILVTKTDDANPTISSLSVSPSTVTVSTLSQQASVTYTAVVTDNVGVSSINLAGATYSGVSGSTYTWTRTFDYADYSYGATSVSSVLTVEDAAGNTSTDSVTVTVTKVDDAFPVISTFSADDTTVQLSSGQTQTVTFTLSATDNVGIDQVALPTATLASASGGTYTWTKLYNHSGGSTTDTLTATVTDTAGNSTSSTITITVTAFSFTIETASYSVTILADLNASITQDGSNLGLQSGLVSSEDGRIVTYSLPTGTATVSCGDITGVGPSGTVGTLPTEIVISVSSEGTLSSGVNINGGPLVANLAEDVLKAQALTWPNEPVPSMTGTSADVLSATFTASDAASYFQSAILALQNLYTGSIISSWTVEVPEIVPSPTSPITEYAAANNRTYPNIFENGEQIVLETTHPYSVTVNDVNGEEVTLVAPTQIYAVVQQHSETPALPSAGYEGGDVDAESLEHALVEVATASETPITTGGTLSIGGIVYGQFDYVALAGGTYTSMDSWFSATADRSAFIVFSGNTTLSNMLIGTSTRKLMVCIYVDGDLTIQNTTINNNRGAIQSSAGLFTTNPSSIQLTSATALTGSAGAGGSGHSGGSGGAGGLFSGGGGGAGGPTSGTTSTISGGAYGGRGGSNTTGGFSGYWVGGGAGNPPGSKFVPNYSQGTASNGSTGCGGTLIVMCKGTLTFSSATLTATGANGGNAYHNSGVQATGGGGSGGGRIRWKGAAGVVGSPSASASGGSKGVSYRNGSYSNGAGNGGSGDYAQIS